MSCRVDGGEWVWPFILDGPHPLAALEMAVPLLTSSRRAAAARILRSHEGRRHVDLRDGPSVFRYGYFGSRLRFCISGAEPNLIR